VLSIPRCDGPQREAAVYVAALLHSLAREEASGRMAPRLTEPGHATWERFRGRLGAADLLELLFEDAAVLHPVPFDPAELLGQEHPGLKVLPRGVAERWLEELGEMDLRADSSTYVMEQARRLGIPTRLGRSDLHRVKPHQRVLELPGSGGQLSHYLVTSQNDLYLQDNFLIACGSWRERVLAGLAAMDAGAPHADFAILDPALEYAREGTRRARFDFVVGLHPDKGGAFAAPRLRETFPNATVLLV